MCPIHADRPIQSNQFRQNGWVDEWLDRWMTIFIAIQYTKTGLDDCLKTVLIHQMLRLHLMVRWPIPQIYCRSLLSNFPSTNPLCVEKCATSATEFNSLPPVSNNPVSGLSLTHGSLSNWAIDGSRLFWQSCISIELKLKLQYAALQLSSSGGCEGVGGPATGAP